MSICLRVNDEKDKCGISGGHRSAVKADRIVLSFYFDSGWMGMVLFVAASFVFIFSSSHESTFGETVWG